MIADMLSNKKPNLIVTDLFIRGRKQRFYCFYYTVLLFCAKNTRLNSMQYFIMKIPDKREFHQIVSK